MATPVLLFLFGGLVGLHLHVEAYWREVSFGAAVCLLMVAFVPAPRMLRRTRSGLAGAAMLLWGFSHHAPEASRGDDDALVIISSGGGYYSESLLLLSNNVVVSARGSAPVGARGKIHVSAGPGLFGRHDARFQVVVSTAAQNRNPVLIGAAWLKELILVRISALPRPINSWVGGLLFGTQEPLPHRVREAFRDTGTYHLLAVSGAHLSLMALAVAAIFRAPFQALLYVGVFSPGAWAALKPCLHVISVAGVCLYGVMAGFPVAAQRAAVAFAVHELTPVFLSGWKLKVRLLLAALAQALIFPGGFVSEASLMSWTAFLVLVASVSASERGQEGRVLAGLKALPKQFARLLRVQVAMTLLAAASFGALPVIGVLVNLVLIPIFPVVFWSAVSLCLSNGGQESWASAIMDGHNLLISAVQETASWTRSVPFGVVSLDGDLQVFRIVAALFAIAVLLKALNVTRGRNEVGSMGGIARWLS